MRVDRFQFRPDGSTFVVMSKSKKGIPFLPGLFLIALGVVVLLFPRFVLAALALFFVLIGSLLCFFAYKFIMLRKQLNSLAKNVESSFYSASIRSSKPDIDVTDTESDKIVYH